MFCARWFNELFQSFFILFDSRLGFIFNASTKRARINEPGRCLPNRFRIQIHSVSCAKQRVGWVNGAQRAKLNLNTLHSNCIIFATISNFFYSLALRRDYCLFHRDDDFNVIFSPCHYREHSCDKKHESECSERLKHRSVESSESEVRASHVWTQEKPRELTSKRACEERFFTATSSLHSLISSSDKSRV